jgi:rhodanese-related sulfurtransferase
VGRPDLSSGDLSKEILAGMLYDSLHQKIIPLPGDVIVYPAHGPGSSCGKNLGPEIYSSIADEKQNNYALRAHTKEDFIKEVTGGLSDAPQYFPINAKINKEGYESLDGVLEKGLRPLSADELKEYLLKDDILVLDTRDSAIFSQGFVPGSVSIGLDGRFAEWAGSLLPFDKPMILVTEKGKERESVVRLARVGFDKMMGYLEGGFEQWKEGGNPLDLIIDIEADELAMDLAFDDNMVIVDVRREAEFADGHISGAVNIPLNDLTDPASMANIEDSHNVYVHCAGGYRSIIAVSLFKRQGIHNLRNVVGGWGSIKEQTSIEIVKDKSVLN